MLPMIRVAFLSEMTPDDVRARMRAFDKSYKRDWKDWMAVAQSSGLASPATALQFRDVLRRWAAVRSKTKGRVVRHCRAEAAEGDLCIEEMLAEAAPFVRELGSFSLRDAIKPDARQERALRFLWDIFTALPTAGTANAVGITKAVKLVTLGRVGPAIDSVVRHNLALVEPKSAEEWIETLRAISADLGKFERQHRVILEELVEEQWRPVAVGRAYDMVAGPAGRSRRT
jgi:hypothetical protein